MSIGTIEQLIGHRHFFSKTLPISFHTAALRRRLG